MSEENVALVLHAVDAWNSGGVDDMLAFYPEDVVWYPFPDAPASSGGLHGHAGIREIMEGWTDGFDQFSVATHECRDLGDMVLWLGEISGTIKGSGIDVRQPMGSVGSDFRAGKIGRVRFFPSWKEALGAAGIEK